MTGWDEDALARLRAAVARGDTGAGLAALAGRSLGPVLQYAGDVLLAAVAAGMPGAEAAARKCLEELDGRGLPGDAELAAELAAALGPRPAPALHVLPVDLGAVAQALDGDPADGPWLLDLERGDVLAPDEPVPEEPCGEGGEGGAGGRYLPIPPTGPSHEEGEEARRGRARRWLAAQGYRPGPRGL